MVAALILFCVVAVAVEVLLAQFIALNAQVATNALMQGDWYGLVQTTWNSFLWWRDDPLLLHANNLFRFEAPYFHYAGASAIFNVGLAMLWWVLAPRKNAFKAVLGASALVVFLRAIFGADQVVISSFAWLPYFILTFRALLTGGPTRVSFLVLSCFFSWRLEQAANQLSLMLMLWGMVVAYLTTPKERVAKTRSLRVGTIVCLAIAALPLFTAPNLNIQAYPLGVHLIPDAAMNSPLIGPAPRIAFVSREIVRSIFYNWGVLSLLVPLLMFVLHKRTPAGLSALRATTAILSLMLAADLLLPEEFAQIAPLASLSRLLPGSFLIPQAPLTLVMLALTVAFSWPSTLYAVCVAGLALVVPMGNSSGGLTSLGRAVNLNSRHASDLFGEIDPAHQTLFAPFVFSPSYAVLNSTGLWPLFERSRIQATSFNTPEPDALTFMASHESAAFPLSALLDKNSDTRWSTGRAAQLGDEWIYARFKERTALSGIELSPAGWVTDFPRGLKISTFSTCPQTAAELQNTRGESQEVLAIPSWQGELGFTRLGYPFFQGPHIVRIYFPALRHLQCLLLEQTGHDSNYDWSVADFKVGTVQPLAASLPTR